MTDQPLRIVFAGTPDFAAGHLVGLVNRGFNVAAVYTQPDRPAGRGKQTLSTPVKNTACAFEVPVFQPASLQTAEVKQLAALSPDVLIVVAYGLILSKEILQIPRFGCINVHASLLPRWRGAAPIERAILAGDRVTGISIMQMDEGLDTGDVLLRRETNISAQDNAETLASRLLALGGQGLAEVLSELSSYQANAEKQDNSLASYAEKVSKIEALINWHSTAANIQHQVQAFFPRSPAYCLYQNNRLRIIQALSTNFKTDKVGFGKPGTILEKKENSIVVACGQNALEVNAVQFPGKNPSTLKAIFNGRPELFNPGETLAS